MENYRKGLFFFLGVFLAASGVSFAAETVEEKKAAANYDEKLPTSEEASALEQGVPVANTPAVVSPVQAAQATVPQVQVAHAPVMAVQPKSVATPAKVSAPATALAPQAVPAAPKTVSKDLPEDQVFAAPKPSGLVEISGYKYPVFLFAPKDYKTDRTYAMIMIAPAEDAKAEQQIETLTGLAQRKSIFILAPYVLWPKEGDTPYTLDQWLLTVKKDVIERFPISRKRVYLVGVGSGAHYAAYMGVKYPKEFSAVALLGEAWDGPFSQLVQPRSYPADQVPFYIALKADGDAKARNQAWFDKLQQKGYMLHLVDYKTDAEFTDLEFKKSVYSWLESASQDWEASVAKSQQTWKGKFKKGVRDFFAV